MLTSTLRIPLPARAASLLMALFLAAGLLVAPSSTQRAEAAVPASVSYQAVRVAASLSGIRYTWGGASPSTGFDCSGLTMYVYGKVGRRLPRTAQQQYDATIKIPRTSARPGDLVFFGGSRSIYHVGIYAGSGYIWHSPRPGKVVSKVRLWTSAVTFARVR
ncbi:C40 family peptidase [Knoellia sp. 3-2P3]|uniref:C40 family peptidase n=1 Tax=unclassified Knoellia TaxID=2618719 RepID=UPI0023DC3013|nr:C40 family peptidase [Knoellia sp. 3-2P3]MDF2093603.1 C40 family peptidase [Knoellia sp. 3-2P3]